MKENLIDIEIIIGDLKYKHINPQLKEFKQDIIEDHPSGNVNDSQWNLIDKIEFEVLCDKVSRG